MERNLIESHIMDKVISCKFRYDGIVRHLDNIALDDKNKQIIGMEIRKSGKFSNKIKRFDLTKIDELKFIAPIERKGSLTRP